MSARAGWVALVALMLVGCGKGSSKVSSLAVHLNEVVPSNHHSCTDETGSSPDWIELYNASDEEVNLEGYALMNDTDAVSDAFRLGASITVPAGGVKVLWADHRPEVGESHLRFKLNSGSERVLFYGPDDSLLDRADWSDMDTDVSLARFPDGTGTFVECVSPTCGVLNGSACQL